VLKVHSRPVLGNTIQHQVDVVLKIRVVRDIGPDEAMAEQLPRPLPLRPIRRQETFATVCVQSWKPVRDPPVPRIGRKNALQVVGLTGADGGRAECLRLESRAILLVAFERHGEKGVLREHFARLKKQIEAKYGILVGILFGWFAAIAARKTLVKLELQEVVAYPGKKPSEEDQRP
jgi:hypothetical protein